MSSIDTRVVQMKFDNKQFESGVKQTLSSLKRLKESLNFKTTSNEFTKSLSGLAKETENLKSKMDFNGAASKFGILGTVADKVKSKIVSAMNDSATSIQQLDRASNSVTLQGIASAIDGISSKFNAMGVVAATVLSNITNTAITAGKQIASAMSLDSIIDGYKEYETQINSVQTILANTQKEGTNIKQVNSALDTLNEYADKTIYNFTEMTRNIGTFTAAGVDLQTSVDSIQGIANLAAISGSSSLQASSAMYQLSQAIASGTVKLMDWNSVVNAGMGGQVFQDALIRTSEHLQTGAKAAIEAKGSFRESLQEGWLTTEVLTETLKQFALNVESAEDYEAAISDLVSQGYTQEEAENIANMARTAMDAATKVKTFSQLIDTLKEALGSGWAQSWRIIIGDFEEAKELWTEVSDVLSSAINDSAEARNNMLQGWSDLGGRQAIIDGLKSGFEALSSVLGVVSKAFRDVFPRTTAEQLYNLSAGFKNFMESLKPTETQLDNIGRVAKGFFSILDIGKQAVIALISPIGRLFGSEGFGSIGDSLLSIVANIADFFTELDQGIKQGEAFKAISDAIGSALETLASVGSVVLSIFSNFSSVFSKAGEALSYIIINIKSLLLDVFNWISENISGGDILAGLAGGGIFALLKNLSSFVDTIKDSLKNIPFIGSLFGDDDGSNTLSMAQNLSDALSKVGEALTAFTGSVKAASLVMIAAAITLLVSSIRQISELSVGDIAKGIVTIRIVMSMLNTNLLNLSSLMSGLRSGQWIATATSLVIIASAIKVLTSAMKSLSEISVGGITKGLVSIVVLLKSLSSFLASNAMKTFSVKTAISLVVLAKSLKILASAVQEFGSMNAKELASGLLGLGVALLELTGVLKVLDKVKVNPANAITIAAVVIAIKSMSKSMQEIGSMSWDAIAKGLSGMGGALAELVVVVAALSKIGNIKSIIGSASLILLVSTLDDISEALSNIGNLNWDSIAKGLSGMGGALAELTIVVGALSKIGNVKSIIGSASIKILSSTLSDISSAMESIGSMNWNSIAKSLIGLGGALTELTVVTTILSKIGGIKSILGSASIVMLVSTLSDISSALKELGQMQWDEITRGLFAMGGTLTELGLIPAMLSKIAPIGSILGSGAILIGVQALKPIADAMVTLGSLTWDQVGIGLAAMGGALAELAIICGAEGAIAGLAGLVGAGTILLATQGIGQLSDAFLKFGSMSWDEVKVGVEAMRDALGELAFGTFINSLGILGGVSISTVAEPLGVLADSVKKWQDVTIPEGLGGQLTSLAGGVTAFTLSGFGAGAISEVAEPLGVLADSIRNWADVSVPEELPGQLTSLAGAIGQFTFSGFGAGAISEVAEPLGTLADSMSKWKDVSIPEGLNEQLYGLAGSISQFTFSGFGAGAISTLAEPLGTLADSVAKWKDVSIPEGLGDQLKGLADAIGAFALSFVAGWSMSTIVEPLGSLADSVAKWNGISLPEGLDLSLQALARGVNAFTDSADAMEVIRNSGDALSGLATGVSGLSGIDFVGIATNLTTFTTTIQGLPEQISSATEQIITSINALSIGIAGQTATVIGAVTSMMTQAVSAVSSQSGAFSIAGAQCMTMLGQGMNSSLLAQAGIISSTMSLIANQIINVGVISFSSGIPIFMQTGSNLMNAFRQGLQSKAFDCVRICSSVAAQCVSAISSQSTIGFYMAGLNMMRGLANGIRDGRAYVVNAAISTSIAALNASKNALGEKSPSKITYQYGEYFDQGLINGIMALQSKVEDASANVGKTAISSMQSTMKNIDFDSDISSRPTITPIVDSNNIKFLSGLQTNKDLSLNVKFADFNIKDPYQMMQDDFIKSIESSNSKVLESINGLRNDMSNYNDSISNMENSVYVDGKKLASSIAKPMNQELGTIYKRGRL